MVVDESILTYRTDVERATWDLKLTIQLREYDIVSKLQTHVVIPYEFAVRFEE